MSDGKEEVQERPRTGAGTSCPPTPHPREVGPRSSIAPKTVPLLSVSTETRKVVPEWEVTACNNTYTSQTSVYTPLIRDPRPVHHRNEQSQISLNCHSRSKVRCVVKKKGTPFILLEKE